MDFVIYFIIFSVFALNLSQNRSIESGFVRMGRTVEESGINLFDCGHRYLLEKIMSEKNITKCFEKFSPSLIGEVDTYRPQYNNFEFNGSVYAIPERFLTKPKSRVTYGKEAEWAEAPWAVYLTTDSFWGDNYICTGTLITLEWVLTAAHCLAETDKTWYVFAGDYNAKKGYKRTANKQYIHPKYSKKNETKTYDFALIKVPKYYKREDSGRYTINPVCLPASQSQLHQSQENAVLYGFGLNLGKQLNRLMRADITLQPYGVYPCRGKYEEDMLCSLFKANEPRFCKGDSGGGLLQTIKSRKAFVVIGVASTLWPNGTGECEPEKGGLPKRSHFSFVPLVVDWIYDTISKN